MLSVASGKMKNPKLRLTLVAMVAFVAYSFFPFMTMTGEVVKFNSPDETANWFTALRISSGEGVGIHESLNSRAQNIIHPRSMTVINDEIVPSSFWGLPVLYGALGLVLTKYILPFITAIITAIAILASYGIWRRYFTERIAIISTTVWAFNPALWYYASRGFYHNVLFVDLLIIALWIFLNAREKKWPTDWLIGFVLTVALALFVRTNEATWLLSLVVIAFWFERNNFRWHQWLTIAFATVASLVAWFSISDLIYANNLTAYSPPVNVASRWQVYFSYLWPFGLDIENMLIAVYRYLIALLLPMWLLIGVGLYFNWRKISNFYLAHKWVVGGAVFAGVWLILYYGSWGVVDTVGFSGVTVGNSHVRYWLPIVFLLSPLVAFGIESLAEKINLNQRRLISASLVLLLVGYGFVVTYFDRYEGLALIAERLQTYRTTAVFVDNTLPSNAIIISDRSDKVFFPERRVVSPGDRPFFTFPEVLQGLPVIMEGAPVYVYSNGLFDRTAAELLGERGIIIGEAISLPDSGWLYQLIKL